MLSFVLTAVEMFLHPSLVSNVMDVASGITTNAKRLAMMYTIFWQSTKIAVDSVVLQEMYSNYKENDEYADFSS